MSQAASILAHLKRGGGITHRQAGRLYGCDRLAARIHDLRSKGHDIRTQEVNRANKRYARYWLVRK